jgi:DNA-binding NarL/FixJ family response regulator
MHTHVNGATTSLTKELRDLRRQLTRIQQRIQRAGAPTAAVAKLVDSNDPLAPLTEREREVCHDLLAGVGNREIAKRYGLSIRTVETHRAHILHKLQVRSLAELILYASEKGVLPKRPASAIAAHEGRRRRGRKRR